MLVEQMAHHALQLQTAAEVSRAASSVLDPDDLIQQVVTLARDRFNLYYAGLFLVDHSGEWALEPDRWVVLRAGTGKAGRTMLQQNHKLELGGDSMVGWCVANRKARIALDVGEEAVRFENPLLPHTRSEVALPLISRGEAIGALTIQSAHEAAFSQEDIAVLQTMADQLANAIANARLYGQAQKEIDERKQAEEALARLAQALDAELEQIFFVASHHLQEPLRMVASYSQLLKQRYGHKLDADADEFIAFAVDGAIRIQSLINDMLAFSRVGTRERSLQPVDCSVILNRVLVQQKLVLKEAGAVITHGILPTVVADEVLLTQLFQHLIENALKFRADRAPEIHVGAAQRRDEWLFRVSDNGIGIEAQYFDRIFRIFQRLHGGSQYPGTGIGLAICKKIVELHGGNIWVESELGEGSTFCFTIPVEANGTGKRHEPDGEEWQTGRSTSY
jgi:signal transduction histidine kinase